MPFSPTLPFVRLPGWRFALRLSTRSKTMFGENDLVDNLSRSLDRVRGKRDVLASEVTTLTAQIAEIEARLSEEKNRRERDRVLGEIETIKRRIKQAASALAPLIVKLCEATEMAAAVVPEARTLDGFLLSVATEVDNVIDPLLRELDRRADEVRVGHAALDLPSLANAAPTELPKDNNDRLLRFPAWLSRNNEGGKKETAENPRSTAA
jgi:cell division septum initiation protein DivIVA